MYNHLDTMTQYNMWKMNLPWIQPYYAVKANPIEPLLKNLFENGSSFDCASKNEIEKVL